MPLHVRRDLRICFRQDSNISAVVLAFDDRVALATRGFESLEKLEVHLSTLEVSDDVTVLVESTKAYVGLVRKDITMAAELGLKNAERQSEIADT